MAIIASLTGGGGGGGGITSSAPDIILQYQVANNTAGGSAAIGANTRPINTEVRDLNSICSISTNKIKLAEAGTYSINAFCGSYSIDFTKLYIYNVTQTRNETGAFGVSLYSNAATSSPTLTLSGIIVADAIDDEFEVRQYCSKARATDGLGVNVNSGSTGVHLHVEISKV